MTQLATEYLYLHILFIKPENGPLLFMDGPLMDPKTVSVSMSGARNTEWSQITEGKTLASCSILKCLHLKIDHMSKMIRSNNNTIRYFNHMTINLLYMVGNEKIENISMNYLNIMSQFPCIAFICVCFFLSLRSMRQLKIPILSTRFNSFHTKTILKLLKQK